MYCGIGQTRHQCGAGDERPQKRLPVSGRRQSGAAEYGGAFYLSETGRGHVGGNTGENNNNYSFDASRVVPTAYENRPAYVGLRFLIKAQ